jgi:hypothetical protein
VYLVLAIIVFVLTLVVNTNVPTKGWTIISSFLWFILWSAIILFLCRHCETGWAWLIVLLALAAAIIWLILVFVGWAHVGSSA